MKTTPQSNTSAHNHSIYDVIISGGGPVGLFLACELALASCSVLILEKAVDAHSQLKQLPFGMRGLNAPSVAAFYRRGLLPELQLHKWVKNPHVTAANAKQTLAGGHFAGIQFFEDKVDTSQWQYRLPSDTPPILLSEMEEVETVLTRRAEALGVLIMRGQAVSSFHKTAEGVTVQCGDQSFEGRWLVGCDGSRSIVRKTGGFEFAGTEPEFTGYSIKADIADPEKLKPGRNITAAGMYLQSQPGYLIIQDFDSGKFHSSELPVTLAHVQEVLRRISRTDVTLTALHIATTWTDRSRQATSYRNGRVMLAGDAAHIHSPLGGQGLNLGLGDAMNLGWKLAATIHGKASESLLDTYFTERYPVGEQVLDWSRAQVAIMKPTPAARALHVIVRDLMNTQDGATYIAGRVWGIATHYHLGGTNPLAGHSVPNFEFEDSACIGDLMHDAQWILLDFNQSAALKALAEKHAGRMKYVARQAKQQLGLSALLIRPDGVVAWAANGEPDWSELHEVTSSWFAV